MKLYMKQKVFSWKDRFKIYDEFENVLYEVEGEFFTMGKKLHIYDASHREAAFIHQKIWSFLPRYFVSHDGVDVAEVVKEFTFIRQEYTVNGPGWQVHGDFMAHEYEITGNDGIVASISKKWFTWGDTYEIDIHNGPENGSEADEIMVLCVVLIIDAVMEAASAAAGASGGAS